MWEPAVRLEQRFAMRSVFCLIKGLFPALTLITNVLGAAAIGCIAGMAARRGGHEQLVLFLKTGVCGGFTTFSTFSLETYDLLNRGHYKTAAATCPEHGALSGGSGRRVLPGGAYWIGFVLCNKDCD